MHRLAKIHWHTL